jgi:ferrous iron transport protein B
MMKIALTGNPNSGKTTLFNAITGRTDYVGNWAGVTVEKKEGAIRKSLNKTNLKMIAVDLPGAYSMSPFTTEESVTSKFIKSQKPDVIIHIIDATNLSRSLFFTTQIIELGIPVVVALNKSDLSKKKKTKLDWERLSHLLKCPVVETVSIHEKNNGLEKLISTALDRRGKSQSTSFNGREKGVALPATWNLSDEERFERVKKMVSQVQKKEENRNLQTKQDLADKILANQWLGIPIFAAIMWAVFSISQTYLGPRLADILVGFIDGLNGWVKGFLGENVSPVMGSILSDGMIGGVGALLGFLPLIMVLFFLLALLEDCGYMARVAVVMDRFFKRVGLSGKSIIPMIIGTGCAIPGVMATRTIKNERQRRTTAMLTPFMPCGAKLPVIALFAGVFFNEAAWVGTFMYFLGIGIIIIGALIVLRITGEKGGRTVFIMELPEYKFPSLKRAAISMGARGKAFIIKAGTIILLCNTAVHIMQTFDWNFKVVPADAQSTSILAVFHHRSLFCSYPWDSALAIGCRCNHRVYCQGKCSGDIGGCLFYYEFYSYGGSGYGIR